jgi:hypothetical protein
MWTMAHPSTICYSSTMSKHAALIALAMLAMGCSGDDSVACTDDLRPSTRVTVLDGAGDPVLDADLTYRVDGDIERSCMLSGEAFYICGFEEQGRFVITALRGDEAGEARVSVRADVCHVVPEDVTLTLEPAS